MAIHHTLVAFDRPLAAAVLPGVGGRLFSEADIAREREKAYREGGDAAREFASQQLVEFRHEVQSLQAGVFAKLSGVEAELMTQLRASLPLLVVDMAKRMLAGFEPTAEQVKALCEEALLQVFPEHEGLELYVSPRDEALLESLDSEWKRRFPDLKIVVDATLGSGDVQVRSRFGLTDATRQAKLQTLTRELIGA
ncbi:FliH/SctL family protein [Nibricoccus sp. IMCC34717]|uniref:FliH/SctL family protein n=1 Tax=Nibricoccus sp. IMCC34717 TaxID=3034021 RepID=UPI00384B8C05